MEELYNGCVKKINYKKRVIGFDFRTTEEKEVSLDVEVFRGYDKNQVANTPMVWVNQGNTNERHWKEYTLETDIDYAVIYTVRVWTKSENYWECYFDLMQKVGEYKEKHGIVGGTPSMNIIAK